MLRTSLVTSVLAASLAAQGWVDRTPANPLSGPVPRFDPAMCWDDAHGYVLMFGGISPLTVTNDTWSWNGAAWTRHSTATLPNINQSPSLRRSTAMVYHAATGEVVLVSQSNTWTWSGSDWLARSPVPAGPFPGSGAPVNMALGRDPAHNQTLLFIGSRTNSGLQPFGLASETYAWDGFSWSTRPTSTSPYPVETPSMAFDPAAGRLVMCTTNIAATQSWFWEWNGTNWNQRAVVGSPNAGAVSATDGAHNKVLMFDSSLDPAPNHTWTLANGAITQLATPVEPTHRIGAAAAFDPVRNRFVLFGGSTALLPNNGNPTILPLGDTWEFELGNGASYATYGGGCAGARGVPSIAAQGTSLPHIGTTFSLQVNNLPLTGPVFLFLGVSNTNYGPTPLPLSLGVIGAPGCTALASGESLFVLTNVLGSAVWQFAVPNAPNAPGASFYNQAFALDPTANALGLTVSNGGQATIGF